MRGVQVGRVAGIEGGRHRSSLKLEIFPDQVDRIPANVLAEIRATTAFGAKYVELIYPDDPSPTGLAAGAVLQSRNVSTEVNTVFESLMGRAGSDRPVEAERGARVRSPTGCEVRANASARRPPTRTRCCSPINPRMGAGCGELPVVQGLQRRLLRCRAGHPVDHGCGEHHQRDHHQQGQGTGCAAAERDRLRRSATDFLEPNKENFVNAVNILEPTTDLLLKYNPSYTCLLVGTKFFLDNGGYRALRRQRAHRDRRRGTALR